MFRFGSFSLFAFVLTVGLVRANDPPSDFNKTIEVQKAMMSAQAFLRNNQAQKAVETLEAQLSHVNGNLAYLGLLRDSYRAYIKDLSFDNQPEQARRYFERLCILDPSAANDLSLRSRADTTPRTFEPEPARPKEKSILPNFNPFKAFAKKEEPKNDAPAKPAVVRFVPGEETADPFHRKHQREIAANPAKAHEYAARASEEFSKRNFSEARMYFEQAHELDKQSVEACREQWSYCIIKGVSDVLDQPGSPAAWADLRRQVEHAISLAASNDKMTAKGQEVLQQIDQRAAGAASPQVQAAKLKHWGRNKEGWQVTESAHFRIFHNESNEFAERVAGIAENTRTTMYRKWFGSEPPAWQPGCELILHPSAASYSKMTGVPASSPGHSRIESDPSGRVLSRRMDLRHDLPGMTDAVLPHETTHIVLAGMFGNTPVPRWVDEGIAVLSEPNEKIDLHRRNLVRSHQEGRLFGLKELMELPDYPPGARISAFYAQSVVLVEFLANQKGPRVFTDFIKDGVRHGYETALQKHYQLTFAQLEQQWQQHVQNNSMRFAAAR
jgi:tetratricopeptide (TPR) repeat protein